MTKQIKLTNILNENTPGYKDRKFGASLPTLDGIQKAYQNKQQMQEIELTEAPMDSRFQKEWEKNCKVLLTHIDHEIKKKDRENYRALSKLRNYVMDASHVPEQLARIAGEE